ncbi:MAG: AAA family ATPase [Magnetococcus sp. XQGC-1]
MLQRIYVNNFRCLVNFDLQFGPVSLLLGSNGSGKSSVFDLLRRLQEFMIGNARIDIFPTSELTRWQTLKQQHFELEITSGDGCYTYALFIDHDVERRRMRVFAETLHLNGNPLFTCKEGLAQLYRDDHSQGPQYPFDWTLSAVGALHARHDNQKLMQFKRELAKLIVIRPIPPLMEREGREGRERLSHLTENFVSWYRHLAQEHLGSMGALFGELKLVLPGFDSLSLKESGEDVRTLKAWFYPPGSSKPVAFDFSELSDGQKMLIMLYTLLIVLKDEGVSLFIDEPDNFLALREVQPWLANLADSVGESVQQAVLISHHPEIINYLGAAHGQWLERNGLGPVRVEKAPSPVPGLSQAETIARGWEK